MHDLACANAIALDLLQGVAENFTPLATQQGASFPKSALGQFSDMRKYPGDVCSCTNSRQWMRRV